MPQLKLVVFDCDGVLFDSLEANRHYYNTMLDHFGLGPMDQEELAYVHMHNVVNSIDFIFRHRADLLEDAHLHRTTVDYSPYLRHMRMEPDLPSFLDFIKPRWRAISTNRTTTMPAVLEMNNLQNCFDLVVTAMDVTHPKPHPEALHKILAHFSCLPEETIYFGDSIIDLKHCQAAAVPMIAFKNRTLAADYHVESFTEAMSMPLFATPLL